MNSMIRKLLNKQVDRFEDVHRAALRGVPADWRDVWLHVECEGSRTSVARFIPSDSRPKNAYLDIPTSDFGCFTALNEATDPRWTAMTLVYHHGDGDTTNFKAEASYDPVPVEDQYKRRLAWKAKYLKDN